MKSKKTTTRTPAKSAKSSDSKTSKKIVIDPAPSSETRKRISMSLTKRQYTPQDVATRAYFISLERGGSPEENWNLAEEEFKSGLWA